MNNRRPQTYSCQTGRPTRGLMKTPQHHWTPDEIEFIRLNYRNTRMSRQELAVTLGVSEAQIHYQIGRMGLAKRTGRRPWSDDEDKRLLQLIGRQSVNIIAKTMNRTVNSVTVRSQRLGASRRVQNGWFTKQQVATILGVNHRAIQSHIDKGELQATFHHGRQPSKKGLAAWHIEQEDLKSFIRKYAEQFNGRNVDLVILVEILAGLIPKRAQEKPPQPTCRKCGAGAASFRREFDGYDDLDVCMICGSATVTHAAA